MYSRRSVFHFAWVSVAFASASVELDEFRSVRFIRSVEDSDRPIELSELRSSAIPDESGDPGDGAALSAISGLSHERALPEDSVSAVIAAGDAANQTTVTTTTMDSYERWLKCIDAPINQTGFNIWTLEGVLGPASCKDLAGKCHSWVNSSAVLAACPVSCFLCDPFEKKVANGPPCYDSVVTGVRFKQGPQATCKDLSNYCQHSTLYYHVQAACRKTCGLCEAHVGHVAGECHDLEPHEDPEFRVAGKIAACEDLVDFCGGGLGSAYLIRHKCPKTCGMCPIITSTTHSSYTTSNEASFNSESEPSDCERRRRWGFCSTRRRRNM